MTRVLTREDLIGRARTVPKSFAGAMSLLGSALTIAGIVFLVESDFGWPVPLATIAAGVALVGSAGVAIQKKFVADAKAAGFDDAQIAAIEDEAERLNEEEA